MEFYKKARDWVVSSGLCILDKSESNAGGVHSFYDAEKKEFGFLYPEITGYNVSLMRFLYAQENNPLYLDIAKLSAHWLENIFDKYGGIVLGVNSKPKKSQTAFSFDSAICAKGLLDLYDVTKMEEYKNYAQKFLDWIISKCLNEDGTVKPAIDLKTGKPFEDAVWYMKSGCFHIKMAMPFLQLSKESTQYREIAERICDTFKFYQNNDGSFSLHKDSNVINLHTHCYAMEGLLFAFSVLKNEKYLDSCKKGLEWTMGRIEQDGSIPLWFNHKQQSKASYPVAQLIRLLVLVNALDKNSKYENTASNLLEYLVSFQAQENDVKMDGGLYEEFYKTMFSWKRQNKINSWGTMFAIQALKWMENRNVISFDESVKQLF
jgi:uncharacterized protein YyaL (SSP411 family)